MAKSTSSSALLSSMRFPMDFPGLRLSRIVPQWSGSTSVRSCLPSQVLHFASRSSRFCWRALAWEWMTFSFPSSASCAHFVSFFDAIGSLWTFPGAFFIALLDARSLFCRGSHGDIFPPGLFHLSSSSSCVEDAGRLLGGAVFHRRLPPCLCDRESPR